MKTVALSEKTYRKLKEMKEKLKAKNFDAVVCLLIEEKNSVPKSMFGAFPWLKRITPEEEREIEGEADE